MKCTTLAVTLATTLLLAACGDGAATDEAVANNAAQSTAQVSSAATSAEKVVTGTGSVTAIDASAGKITINHGPIPEAGWPAMTMAFTAQPAVLDGVAVGDAVSFDLALKDGAGEVTTIRKER